MPKISPTARYPHAVTATLSPRYFALFLRYLDERADAEGVSRWKQTDGSREALEDFLDRYFAGRDIPLDASEREVA